MRKDYESLRDLVITNIKYHRKLAKISQEDLSKKLGKKEDFIKKIEDMGIYRKFLTISLIDKIADILNVPVIEFFNKRK